MDEANVTTALTNANHYVFLAVGATNAWLAAYVSFVHFDSTIQHRLFVLHSGADAMTEIPRRFVAHSEGPLHLVRREPLAGFAEKQRCDKPLTQRQVGVVEDRTDRDAELVFTDRAPEQFHVGFEADHIVRLATRAFGTIRPTQTFEKFPAFIIGIEQFQKIRESHSEHPN
jgi:hypothetical protein